MTEPSPATGTSSRSPGRHTTAQTFAYETIRKGIATGKFQPGGKLNQNEIAAMLGLSTTPVREALRRLASEGLVRIDSYRGATVRELDRDEFIDVYDARLVLEPIVVRRAVERITAEELDTAQKLYERMDDVLDVDDWVEANRDFHATLSGAARSEVLEPVIDSLRDRAAPYVRLSLLLDHSVQLKTNQEHAQILEAFRQGAADRAAELEVEHLRGTLKVVLENWDRR